MLFVTRRSFKTNMPYLLQIDVYKSMPYLLHIDVYEYMPYLLTIDIYEYMTHFELCNFIRMATSPFGFLLIIQLNYIGFYFRVRLIR